MTIKGISFPIIYLYFLHFCYSSSDILLSFWRSIWITFLHFEILRNLLFFSNFLILSIFAVRFSCHKWAMPSIVFTAVQQIELHARGVHLNALILAAKTLPYKIPSLNCLFILSIQQRLVACFSISLHNCGNIYLNVVLQTILEYFAILKSIYKYKLQLQNWHKARNQFLKWQKNITSIIGKMFATLFLSKLNCSSTGRHIYWQGPKFGMNSPPLGFIKLWSTMFPRVLHVLQS